MDEIWTKVKGNENYSVSSRGNVRNDRTGRILKQSGNPEWPTGRVSISLDGEVGRTVKVETLMKDVKEVFAERLMSDG